MGHVVNGTPGHGRYWLDLDRPAVGINLAGPAAAPAYNAVDLTIDFAAGATNTIQTIYETSHGWLEASDVYLHIHCWPETNAAGTVVWEVSHRWLSHGAVVGAFSTVEVEHVQPGVARYYEIRPLQTISAAGRGISDILQVQIQRLGLHANDTYPGLLQVVTFGCHVIDDYPGSRQIYAK